MHINFFHIIYLCRTHRQALIDIYHIFQLIWLSNNFLNWQQQRKLQQKKTPKKDIDKPSIDHNDSLLKKNGIDEPFLDDLIKFAKKEKVEIPDIKDDSDRVNIVLPVLAHLAQKKICY